MNESDSYSIRPAGRHILTIGRDLIHDGYAAVLELVKNSYDADSPDVKIEFRARNENGDYEIIISDNGHGMSRDTVINKWMVPSTNDKEKRRSSPNGRIMQGRKGIGRYAAGILGKDLLLETVTSNGEKTSLFVEWESFENAEYLEDVEILIETARTNEPQGTKLTITTYSDFLIDWDSQQFDLLSFELKKLMPPVPISLIFGENSKDNFEILLIANNLSVLSDFSEKIEPYPIFDLYDYRISGTISANGETNLFYSTQKARNSIDEKIDYKPSNLTCGSLSVDIRVYDREKEAIEMLIARGLKDEKGEYVGKLQARRLLNEYNGIGVYRNGFRIRPLGDADFDWLKLNERRVQKPSLRIGSNQVIGYVQIQSEEQSGLIEKSARDGLKDNPSFRNLKAITKEIISFLEQRRFSYRQKTGLSRQTLKVEQQLEQLFSFEELTQDIGNKLKKSGISDDITQEIISLISKESESKTKAVEEIRNAVAVYQGQATLGKIMNVVLHEGRRPLNFFKNQIPNFTYWYQAYLDSSDTSKLEKLTPIASNIEKNADFLALLFKRLDPLAAGKRGAKKEITVFDSITDSFAVFEQELKSRNISLSITGDKILTYQVWPQDIYAIFTNLIDNSIYWLDLKEIDKGIITIEINKDVNDSLYVDYRDNGPGIEPHLIEDETIFNPEFTTKIDGAGSGLGLAIAGEAAIRNRLELKAFESDVGAYFRLQTKEQN